MSYQAEIFDPFEQDNPGAVEKQRGRHGRLYDLGPTAVAGERKYAAVATSVPVHWQENGEYKDIDLTLQSITGGWGIASGPYLLELSNNKVRFRITNKENGKVIEYTLLRINDIPVENIGAYNVSPTRLKDKQVAYSNVVPGLDILFIPKPDGVEWFKRLQDTRINSLMWGVEYPTADGNDGFVIQQDAVGEDAAGREFHVENALETRTDRRAGYTSILRTETFIHEVKTKNENRITTWVNDVTYPVLIDASVTVNIGAEGDDGSDSTSAFLQAQTFAYFVYAYYPGSGWYSIRRHPMWRFLSVAVPNGATIDAGTVVKANVNAINNSGPKGPYTGQKIAVYGNDVDSCGTLGNTNRIFSGWTLTPGASPGIHHLDATGVHSIDVQSIVQTIVNRAGWASGNIGIGGKTQYLLNSISSAQADWAKFDDYPAGTTTQLVVVYTAASGTVMNQIQGSNLGADLMNGTLQ